jgi:hypothetical protein
MNHRNRRLILIIHGIYCHHLFIFLITIIPDIIQLRIEWIIRCNVRESALAIVMRVSGLRRLRTQNGRCSVILNATLNLNAPEYTVGIDTGLTCRLLHALAELLVPVVPKVSIESL